MSSPLRLKFWLGKYFALSLRQAHGTRKGRSREIGRLLHAVLSTYYLLRWFGFGLSECLPDKGVKPGRYCASLGRPGRKMANGGDIFGSKMVVLRLCETASKMAVVVVLRLKIACDKYPTLSEIHSVTIATTYDYEPTKKKCRRWRNDPRNMGAKPKHLISTLSRR